MATFEDTLKAVFYNSGASKANPTARICLLDNSGNPIGSDTFDSIQSLLSTDDNDVVDLGLPSGTLWAKKNLGACKETDYGWYAAWGEQMAYESAASRNAILSRSDGFSSDAYQASSIGGNLTLANDVAHLLLGGKWHMPSREQFVELFNSDYTTNEWVTNYNGVSGLNGLLVTSKINGNTVFFPAAGQYNDTSLNYKGSAGYCWTSSVYSTNAKAYCLDFTTNSTSPQLNAERRRGFSIRPVKY